MQPSISTTLTDNQLATVVSSLLGWIYFLCWSASFYPQALLLYRKKSSLGLSLDLVLYNVVGFLCYTVRSSLHKYNNYKAINMHRSIPLLSCLCLRCGKNTGEGTAVKIIWFNLTTCYSPPTLWSFAFWLRSWHSGIEIKPLNGSPLFQRPYWLAAWCWQSFCYCFHCLAKSHGWIL